MGVSSPALPHPPAPRPQMHPLAPRGVGKELLGKKVEGDGRRPLGRIPAAAPSNTARSSPRRPSCPRAAPVRRRARPARRRALPRAGSDRRHAWGRSCRHAWRWSCRCWPRGHALQERERPAAGRGREALVAGQEKEGGETEREKREWERERRGDREGGGDKIRFCFFILPLSFFNNYILVPKTSISSHSNPYNFYFLTF